MAGNLKVLMLSAEMVPFAKLGGLADVAGALPKALKALGVDVRACIPRYGRIDPIRFGLEPVVGPIEVPMERGREEVNILGTTIGDGIPVYLVDNDKYFNREGVYGYYDDGERFILFCRAALEMLRYLDWQPDIIHCNDWHTALVPNWLKTIYQDDPFFKGVATVYTIHNLQYQGVFGQRILEIAGIDSYGFLYHPQIGDLANYVDFMARGIHFADMVNLVSERYAEEVLTPEYGEKLDPLLRDKARDGRLFGVLNGIDYEEFDPAADRYIARNFDVTTLDQRSENKAALQREAGLEVNPDVPLLGIVSRMVDQKGFDLLAQIFPDLMEVLHAQFVLLGTGDPHYHGVFQGFQQRYQGQASVFLTFNAALAQKIYAGTDMFLMPSRYEPCGLGQLISLRFGSIPIVRQTGGLADTVQDYDPRTGSGNGFSFARYHHMDFFAAVTRAVEHYREAETWRMLQVRGMETDHSWTTSARRYVQLFEKAVEFRRGSQVAV